MVRRHNGIITVEQRVTPAAKAFLCCTDPVIGFIGGWGSSKTWSGARKSFMLGSLNKDCAGLVCGPSLGQVMDTSYPAVMDFLEENEIPYHNFKGSRPAIVLPWGHPEKQGPGWIYFRSLDSPGAIKGLTVAWVWIDEAGTMKRGEEGWHTAFSRVRDPKASLRQKFVTTTGEAPWLADKFDTPDGHPYVRASTRETVAAGILPADYVEELERELPADLVEVYVDGGFLRAQTGLVYKNFSLEGNVSTGADYIPSLPLWLTCDFGLHPMAWLICQPLPDGQTLHVIGEIVRNDAQTSECALEFYNRYGGHQGEIVLYGDPAGSAKSTTSKLSNYEIIREVLETRGCKTRTRYRSFDPGQYKRVNCMNRMLCDTHGRHWLKIHPRCYHAIYDFQHVQWTDTGEIDKKTKHPKFGWTISHASDAGCYVVEYEFPIARTRVKIL